MENISEHVRREREARGVTIEELAKGTFISVAVLKDIESGKFTLIDRKGEQFDIFPDQDCNNLIFNSHCLYIDHLEKLEVDFILLSFSNEAPEITKAVFRDFKNNIMFAKPRQISLKTKLTNGYFYDWLSNYINKNYYLSK